MKIYGEMCISAYTWLKCTLMFHKAKALDLLGKNGSKSGVSELQREMRETGIAGGMPVSREHSAGYWRPAINA